MSLFAGVDIGGTKCAVCLGVEEGEAIRILGKRRFPTPATPEASLAQFSTSLADLFAEHGVAAPAAIGISCGGPLDSQRGLIQPTLPECGRKTEERPCKWHRQWFPVPGQGRDPAP